MALLWCDGFDHYGLDTARMTEGPYDQVDAAFTLSEANPRTGARCLRRDNSQSDSKLIFDLLSNKDVVGSGVAFYIDQMPSNFNSYALFRLMDSGQETHVTLWVQPDGSIYAKRGDFDGVDVAISDDNIIVEGQYNHLEFGIIADDEVVESELFFNEKFADGLDQYTVINSQFFSVESTSKGDSIRITNVTDNPQTGSATRSNIEPRNYFKCAFYGRVNGNQAGGALDADIGIFLIRDSSGTAVINTTLSRDGDAVGSDEELFIQGQPIVGKLTVGEWYLFEYVLDWDTGNFDYTVTGDTEGLFAEGTLSFTNSSPISQLHFQVDVDTGEVLNDSANFADIKLFYTDISGNDAGYLEVRVNGVSVVAQSSLNLTNTEVRGYRFLSLECGGSNDAHGVTTDVDDYYIWDDAGAWNNSFIGDRRCFLLRPNQDTNIADFDPSSGSFGYKMIDDESPDDDSTYIIAEAYLQSGSPLTGTSEFEIENLPDGTSLISGINVVTRASKTDSTSAEIFTSINSGADSLSQAAHTLTTSYRYSSDIYEYDPATIASLTKDGFDDLSVSITADNLQEEITVISPDIVSPSVIPGSPADSDPSIPSDYIARYLFDGDFADETGNFDGTNNGATFVGAGNGPNGTDFGINAGAGKFVSLPVALAASLGSGGGTLSCAIKTGAAANLAIALCGSDTATNSNFLLLALGDGTALRPRGIFNSGNSYRGDDSGVINIWHHMIIRSDGSSTTFRLNGVNLGTVVVAGSDTGAWFGDVASIDNMLIGRLDRSSADNNGQSFDIAFLTLFDREISDAEAQQLETEY